MFGLTPFSGAPFDGIMDDVLRHSESVSVSDTINGQLDAYGPVGEVVSTSTTETIQLVYSCSVSEFVSISDHIIAQVDIGKTRIGRKNVLDHFLGRVSSPFGNVYAALFTADPTVDGLLVNELTQAGYSRVNITSLIGDANLTTGQTTNTAFIDFGPAGEDWPSAGYLGIIDQSGNIIYFSNTTTPRTAQLNDILRIPVSGLIVGER